MTSEISDVRENEMSILDNSGVPTVLLGES